jgi:hypothetical protein
MLRSREDQKADGAGSVGLDRKVNNDCLLIGNPDGEK